jgi:hypothetical protein
VRVFLDGVRDAMEPTGQALIILSWCILAIGVSVFAFKTWILYSWPRTNGTEVRSHIVTSTSDDGIKTCSAVESVQYAIDGRQLVIEAGGHSFTSNCLEIEARVATALGQNRTVAYNKRAPGATYVDPSFNMEFYLVSVVMVFLAGAFGLGGWVLIRASRWMAKRGLDLP